MSKSIFDNKIGIYFLLDANKVILYIGKTRHYPDRVLLHKSSEIPYEKVRFLPCKEEDLVSYEMRLIAKFRPIYNYNGNPDRSKNAKKVHRVVTKWEKKMKFRKLAEQSYIGFGKYKTAKVADLLRLNKEAELAQLYYGCSHISYLPHLLEQLRITGEWVIEKPGTNDDLFYRFCDEFYPKYVENKKRNASRGYYEKSKMNAKREKLLNNSKSILMQQNRRGS